jgi:hypothetical protein
LDNHFAREEEDSSSVVRKSVEDFKSCGSSCKESIWGNILGEHASRDIDTEQKIAPLRFDFYPLLAGFRFCEGDDQ